MLRRPRADGDRGGRDRRGDAGQRDAVAARRAARRARPGPRGAWSSTACCRRGSAAPRSQALASAPPSRAVRAARVEEARARAHRAQVSRLRRGLGDGVPVRTLPYLFEHEGLSGRPARAARRGAAAMNGDLIERLAGKRVVRLRGVRRRGQDHHLGGGRDGPGGAGRAGVRRDDRPGAAARRRAGDRAAGRRAAGASTTARFAGHGIVIGDGGELWALMLDPKRTFDELIGDARPGRRGARRDPGEPDLPRAVERGRGVAGVHGDRQVV